jgi:hypothetical protein
MNHLVNGGRLAGHGLRHEGRHWVPGVGYTAAGTAPGICECGAESEPLPTAAARKRWHRDHKAEERMKTIGYTRES